MIRRGGWGEAETGMSLNEGADVEDWRGGEDRGFDGSRESRGRGVLRAASSVVLLSGDDENLGSWGGGDSEDAIMVVIEAFRKEVVILLRRILNGETMIANDGVAFTKRLPGVAVNIESTGVVVIKRPERGPPCEEHGGESDEPHRDPVPGHNDR